MNYILSFSLVGLWTIRFLFQVHRHWVKSTLVYRGYDNHNCYNKPQKWTGEKKVLPGQYNSLSPSQGHLSHTTNITPFENKVLEIYFYKELCSFVHWSSSLLLTRFPLIFVLCIYMWLYNILSILAGINNVIFWMLSIRPLTFKSSIPYIRHVVALLGAPITTDITVTFMFHSFSVPKQGPCSYLFFSSFAFWSPGSAISIVRQVHFFVDNHHIWLSGQD